MEYKSNANTVFLKLGNDLKKVAESNIIQRAVGTYLFEDNKRRVHNEGKAVDGSKIGNYSIAPALYVNPKNSPKKFPVRGKYGNNKFKNGKPHKTGYFDSYKSFRAAIGRETNYVNLQLSGKLLKDLRLEPAGNNYQIGFMSQYGAKISEAQEAKWGKQIWGVTKKNYDKIYNEIIPNIIRRAKS